MKVYTGIDIGSTTAIVSIIPEKRGVWYSASPLSHPNKRGWRSLQIVILDALGTIVSKPPPHKVPMKLVVTLPETFISPKTIRSGLGLAELTAQAVMILEGLDYSGSHRVGRCDVVTDNKARSSVFGHTPQGRGSKQKIAEKVKELYWPELPTLLPRGKILHHHLSDAMVFAMLGMTRDANENWNRFTLEKLFFQNEWSYHGEVRR